MHSLLEREGVRSTLLQERHVKNVDLVHELSYLGSAVNRHPGHHRGTLAELRQSTPHQKVKTNWKAKCLHNQSITSREAKQYYVWFLSYMYMCERTICIYAIKPSFDWVWHCLTLFNFVDIGCFSKGGLAVLVSTLDYTSIVRQILCKRLQFWSVWMAAVFFCKITRRVQLSCSACVLCISCCIFKDVCGMIQMFFVCWRSWCWIWFHKVP